MKYIVDLPEAYTSKSALFGDILSIPICLESGKRYGIPTGIKLEPYTEPDRKAVDLQYAHDIENVARMNYNEGAKDAWEFARAINYLEYDDFVSCFGGKTEEAVYELSYSEVKSKYETWKKSKDEIRVGDEIRIKTSYSADAVVIGMDDYDLFIVWKDGETDRIEPPERKQWVKTGRHFKEVEELLKKITEESNED